ncbi:MAG TPA: LPS assembly lipoprotein LptE [Verrucomicrobiae bacterium]|jgi:hypothetical protein|nr:LPS assembly lipoprotein LptE [Verrucomicrobiae bacterium]
MPALSVSCLLLFLLSGCGYQLGPTNGMAAGSRTVQINLFRNQTFEPRLPEPLATSLRRWIQRDGTYRLATQNDADVIVDGTITEYNRVGVSFQPTDVLTVRDYDIFLVTKFTATERATGRVLASATVTGRTTVRVSADQSSAERQAAPLLAEDVARRITAMLVDGSW